MVFYDPWPYNANSVKYKCIYLLDYNSKHFYSVVCVLFNRLNKRKIVVQFFCFSIFFYVVSVLNTIRA